MQEANDGIPAQSDEIHFTTEPARADNVDHSCWKLLVVDAEEAVHHVTRMVLDRFRFDGRRVCLLSAYSAAEARVVLASHPDIAVILLDVVMETADAGLLLARHIRDTLKNYNVRIILRTGQPGEVPEHDVAMSCDINDYLAKTRLTADKLCTSVTSALRAWRDIHALEQSRRSLQHVLDASGTLLKGLRPREFAADVLAQLLAIARRGTGPAPQGFTARRRQKGFVVAAGTGPWANRVGTTVNGMLDEGAREMLAQSAVEKAIVWRDGVCCGRCRAGHGDTDELLFVLVNTGAMMPLDRDLLRVYFGSVTLAYANATLSREIIESQREMIHTLSELIETHSLETANHVLRVGEMARLLALHAGVDEEMASAIRLAAPMHDVGKVGIPDRILNKPGRLTPEEFAVMRSHAALGHGILCKSDLRIMRVAARIAHQHHERWDGGGYPRGLAGEEISLEGRITAIVDVFDALTSRRVYRDARPVDEVFAAMREDRGRHFDPELLDVFLAHGIEFAAVLRDYPDHGPERDCLGAAVA